MPRLDVLLWGASSSTGKVIAAYLAKHYGTTGAIRWALGGRSRERVEAVRDGLPNAAGLPLIIGDGQDAAFLDGMVRQAKVVISTVGPYMRYGAPLVTACARHGVDYVDLTGEVLFMRAMIDEHHALARRTGARIVHACGFDSVPSDLGVLLLQAAAAKRFQAPCVRAKLFVLKLSGGLGGGTAATLIDQGARMADPVARQIIADPYALDPDRRGIEREGLASLAAHFDEDLGEWVGPFVMAGVNTRVVRRSNALLGYPYGRDFRYAEGVACGRGVRGRALAGLDAAGLKAAMLALGVAPARQLVSRLLPPPGKGPSAAVMARGHFTLEVVGATAAAGKLRVRIVGQSDPGHGETAKMVVEAALCLAADDAGKAGGGGMLTPASAMGMPLVERLRKAGMTFEVLG